MTESARCYRLSAACEALQGRVRWWQVHLDLMREPDAATLQALASSERRELLRLRQREDRVRFAGVRAALRQVLMTEYGLEQTVQIQRDRFGKPTLAMPKPTHGRLAFNVSHAGALGLIAVSYAGQVGVDVEKPIPLDVACLAEMACTPLERDALTKLDATEGLAAFFRMWVGKEAALKAVGTGIAGGHMPGLSLLDDGSVRAANMPLPFDPATLKVEPLPVADGYCAAVALFF